MASKILIFGNGLVGKALYETFEARHEDVYMWDGGITDMDDIGAAITAACSPGVPPTVLINAIGKTGRPNVDWCEDHQNETFFSNVDIAVMICHAAKLIGAQYVHISSGCIYNGLPPDWQERGLDCDWNEEDPPNFEESFYSFSKKVAERLVSHQPHVLTVRLRMPVTPDKNPRGLLAKLMSYDTIIEAGNSITYLPNFVSIVADMVTAQEVGIFNIVNPQPATHKQILQWCDEVWGTDIVSTKKFVYPHEIEFGVARTNVILSTTKLQAFEKEWGGVPIQSTEDAIKLAALGYQNNG